LDGSAQHALRFGHASVLLEIERHHVEEQRMLEAVRERSLRKGSRLRVIAALRRLLNGAQGRTVGFEIACQFYRDHMRCKLAMT
jgi:hypothetical protein